MTFGKKTSKRYVNSNLASLKIYGEQQYNALNKIHSIMFNLAQEGRITGAELEDYNKAGEVSFDALEKLRMLVRKMEEERQEAVTGMHRKSFSEKKLRLICEMIGLKEEGIEELTDYPLQFLEAINKAFLTQKIVIEGELQFRFIRMAWRWVETKIYDDRRNLSSATMWKKLYNSEHKEVRSMAREMIEIIAKESSHLIDGLRQGKTFEELQTRITEHWYGQLSKYNFTGK